MTFNNWGYSEKRNTAILVILFYNICIFRGKPHPPDTQTVTDRSQKLKLPKNFF